MRPLACALALAAVLTSSATAQPADSIQVETLVKSTASWDGTPLPAYPGGQPEVTLLRITIPPKAQLPLHEHPVINAGVLLEGQLTVVTEAGETLHLNAGDPIIELVGKRHYGRNEGAEPAVILVFYAGTAGAPITIRAPSPNE